MIKLYYLLPLFSLFAACGLEVHEAEPLHREAPLYPDVAGITLPENLAPIRFQIPDSCGYSACQAIFESGKVLVIVAQREGEIAIAPQQWRQLVAAGDTIQVHIQGKREGKWVEFDPFPLCISHDCIDPYLSYRLIEPGYEVWSQMGIYQRDLTSYEETPILENRQTKGGCMNCHTYNQHNPAEMLFHLRAECGGTYLVRKGKVEKLNTKTPETISALVYPSWHPSGRFVAFSTNETKQSFHSTDRNRIEVFDKRSDIVIYDVEKHEVFSCPQLKSEAAFETFPSFSPDGKTLYFCSADSLNVTAAYDLVRYSLCSIGFDVDSASAGGAAFSSTVDTLYHAREEGASVSFPRVSPDGTFLMFTRSAYGNFSIWHKDADLYLLHLQSREIVPLSQLNSPDVESFHSWSSTGRWVVFSSRREDGLYTRPYLTHVDADGQVTKPFPLPQESLSHDALLMKSYNLPEFMQGIVCLPGNFETQAKEDAGINVQFRQ